MIYLQVQPHEAHSDLDATVDVRAEALTGSGCKGQVARARIILRIENHSLYLKHRFFIDYAPDAESIAICHSVDESACSGGAPALSVSFPLQQGYWQGTVKTLIRAVCWSLTDEEVDFNLQVRIRSRVFSPDPDLHELKDRAINTSFIVHGAAEESHGG